MLICAIQTCGTLFCASAEEIASIAGEKFSAPSNPSLSSSMLRFISASSALMRVASCRGSPWHVKQVTYAGRHKSFSTASVHASLHRIAHNRTEVQAAKCLGPLLAHIWQAFCHPMHWMLLSGPSCNKPGEQPLNKESAP